MNRRRALQSMTAVAVAGLGAPRAKAAGVSTYVARFRQGRRYTLEVANAMPREHYGFKPAPDMPSFAALMIDIATTTVRYFAQAKGVEPRVHPPTTGPLEQPPETADKATVVFYLSEALLGCLKILESFTDAELEKMLPIPGAPSISVLDLVLSGFLYMAQHRGYAEAYLPLKGIARPQYRD